MSEPNGWNAKVIAEFRANDGRVGGTFEGAPVLLRAPPRPQDRHASTSRR